MNVQRGILLNSTLNNRDFQIINSCKTRRIPIRQKQVISNYIFFKQIKMKMDQTTLNGKWRVVEAF